MTAGGEKDGWKPGNAQILTAYLTVPDAGEASKFYAKAFGFVLGEALENSSGELLHASMIYRDVHVFMLGSEKAPWSNKQSPATGGHESPVTLYLYNPDVESLFKRAVDAGGKAVGEIRQEFWGDLIVEIKDPFGYEWTLATKVGELDESKKPKFD